MRKIFLLALASLIFALPATAQRDKVHEAKKLYTDLRLSLPNLFLGRLSGQYEMQIGKSALNLTGNIAFAGDKKGFLGGLGYRYYLSNRRTSSFIGLIVNFSDYKKEEEATKTTTDAVTGAQTTTNGTFYLLGQTINVGINVGKRWSILRIFNITARLGYGVPIQTQDLAWKDGQVPDDSQTFQNKYLFASGIDGELSFGWHFGRRK
jgi:hypothetical protein